MRSLSGNLGLWRRTYWFAYYRGGMERIIFHRSTGPAMRFLVMTGRGLRPWI